MLFNSLGFILFFIIVLIFYYGPFLNWINKKRMLLLTSYIFYGLWNPPLIVILWISTWIDWFAGNKLSTEDRPRVRKYWLALSMVVNLGFLGFFKYGNFLLENFTFLLQAVGIKYEALPMNIVLPMGISFYTFQTMSYTIDIYLKKIQPARTLLDFSLYVTFFPQLVAGPIVRAQDLISQFYTEKKASLDTFLWGCFLLTLGLFEKVVLADGLLSETSDAVFNHGKALHFLDAWSGTLAFSGQIFFDFAGYSTCAIGIAYMLGFTLVDNFLYPYGSIGFSDFWRRWHITLSSWLKDYIYIPLGGNRHGVIQMYMALMLTMLLGGLWHGAAWTFVFWGFLHGMYLILERVIRSRVKVELQLTGRIFWAFFTYTLVNFTWVFFRAKEFGTAKDIIASMLYLNVGGDKILAYFDIIKVLTISILLFWVHFYMRKHTVKMVASKLQPLVLGLIWAIMIFCICIAQGSGEQFIYFQF